MGAGHARSARLLGLGVTLAAIAVAVTAWTVLGSARAAVRHRPPAVHRHPSRPGGPADHRGRVIHVIEHAVTDTVVHSGGSGDVTGNLLTWHNNVYNAQDSTQEGTDQGSCVRIDPAAGSWQCNWSTFLRGGQIVVEGPYYDTRNSVLAIIGGTGAFAGARGQMALLSRDGGREYDFVFELLG